MKNNINPAIFVSVFLSFLIIGSYAYFSTYGQTNSNNSNGSILLPTFNQSGNKLEVTTTFRAITLLVEPIGGNLVKINQILPPGADPHNFEPTPSNSIGITKSSILFYDSNNLEQWAVNFVKSVNPNINLVSFQSSINSTQSNPHFWLAPVLAISYVKMITQTLQQADPKNSLEYESNEKTFLNQLELLNQTYYLTLSNCSTRSAITSHSFLNYLSNEYNFSQISIAGPSPDATPSISQIISVINQSKTVGARGVLVEPDETINLANSISTELSIPTIPFDTMEVLTSSNSNYSYIQTQMDNLQKLSIVMGCNQTG